MKQNLLVKLEWKTLKDPWKRSELKGNNEEEEEEESEEEEEESEEEEEEEGTEKDDECRWRAAMAFSFFG